MSPIRRVPELRGPIRADRGDTSFRGGSGGWSFRVEEPSGPESKLSPRGPSGSSSTASNRATWLTARRGARVLEIDDFVGADVMGLVVVAGVSDGVSVVSKQSERVLLVQIVLCIGLGE